MKAELELDTKCTLGEGSIWCPFTQQLLWVDILNGKLFQYDYLNTKENKSLSLVQFIGTVVPVSKQHVAAALIKGFAVLDRESGEIVKNLGNPEHQLISNRFNDGKCDPQGRLWCGSMHLKAAKDKGSVYCLREDGSITKELSPVTISNGLTWSLDGQTMYYIDTVTGKVDAFDFDGDSGKISNRRTCVQVEEGHGDPDGMTIDSDGMLWVAMWGGWRVNRYNPTTGELLDFVSVPASQVSSCAFGGSSLDQLFITTAREGLSAEELASEPLAGGLFRIDLSERGIRGVPANVMKVSL